MAQTVKTVVFADEETPVVLVPYNASVVVIQLPTLDAGDLDVEGSLDGVTYAVIKDASGTDFSWAGATGDFIAQVPVNGLHSFKLVSAVDQAGEEVLVRFVQDKMMV